MDIEECRNKGLVKQTVTNPELITSLIEMAGIKEETVKEARLTQRNISVFISVAYDSLRLVMEAICNQRGYKVLNHICLGELLKNDIDYETFNRLRWTRNNISYYGKQVELRQGRELIEEVFRMTEEVRMLLGE